MPLTREQMLSVKEYETRTVSAFGGDVRVKSLDVSQLFQFNALLEDAKKSKNFGPLHIQVCCWCVVDENDESVFKEEDLKPLAKKSFKSLNAVFKSVLDMNTISEARVDEAKKD